MAKFKMILISFLLIITFLSFGCYEKQTTEDKVWTPKYDEFYSVNVTNVIDGDTFDAILPNGTSARFRLLGVDAPENNPTENKINEYGNITDLACLTNYGLEAKEFTNTFLIDEMVNISFDSETCFKDIYNRWLVYVILPDGNDFNGLLIENGYARACTEENCEKKLIYQGLEEMARDYKLGLWNCPEEKQEYLWPMFRHDLSHTAQTIYTGPASPALAWNFTANDGIVSSPTIGPNGTIYFGAGWYYGGTNDSCLYALNPNGTLKWCYKAESGIFSSPALCPDGTIYFSSLDRYLYAIEDLDTHANLKWKTDLGFMLYSSPAIGADGTIYIGSLNFKIYALDPNGNIKWSYPTEWCVFSSPAIGQDGTVYIGSKDHNLYALSDEGDIGVLNWKFSTGIFYDGHLVDSSPAIGVDGTIYFGTDQYGADGHEPIPVKTSFWAVNPDGTLKWSLETEDGVESSPAIGPDGTIYFGSYDNHLYAVKDDGTKGVLKWKFQTNDSVDGSPTIDGDGVIYFGSRDSTFYALNPNGTIKWIFSADGGFESSPTIDGNGYLYIGSFDGKLYALGTGASDVGVVSVDDPINVLTNNLYVPAATLRNYRSIPQSFETVCAIDLNNTIIYSDTISVNLSGGSCEQYTFSPWTAGPDVGITYNITVTTLLPSDENTSNNERSVQMITSQG
jgi:outer membrane protein assembly factor BamB